MRNLLRARLGAPAGVSQSDDMRTSINNKKEATPFEVATAKMPPWLFAKLEEFRHENDLQTRNAAVNILIMLALSIWGDFDREKCLEFIEMQGMTPISDHMLSVMSESKGGSVMGIHYSENGVERYIDRYDPLPDDEKERRRVRESNLSHGW